MRRIASHAEGGRASAWSLLAAAGAVVLLATLIALQRPSAAPELTLGSAASFPGTAGKAYFAHVQIRNASSTAAEVAGLWVTADEGVTGEFVGLCGPGCPSVEEAESTDAPLPAIYRAGGLPFTVPAATDTSDGIANVVVRLALAPNIKAADGCAELQAINLRLTRFGVADVANDGSPFAVGLGLRDKACDF